MSLELPILGDASLCQRGQQSCGACCWGKSLSREVLTAALERNRTLFERIRMTGQLPGRWRLLWHELVSRRGRDLFWSPLLWIPGIGARLKKRLAAELVCAFVAFDSSEQKSVGCMLHPLRHDGQDLRRETAFRLLKNVDCSQTSYICDGCKRYNEDSADSQQHFSQFTSSLDWFNYSIVVQAFGAKIPLPFEAHPRNPATTDE
jgi:hypothetical protein